MPGRPSKRVIALELAALAAALGVAIWLDGDSNWDLALFAILLATSVVGDLTAVDTPASRMSISSSFLTIVTATVFLGEAPAALIGVVTIGAGWLRFRYAPNVLLINLVTYAWFPLLSGLAFTAALQGAGVGRTDGLFYLFVFGLFTVALAINFTLIAGYFCYVDRTSLWAKVRRGLAPLLPSELASALLAVGVAFLYVAVRPSDHRHVRASS